MAWRIGRAVVRFSGSINIGAACVEFICVPVSGIALREPAGTFFVSCWKVGGGWESAGAVIGSLEYVVAVLHDEQPLPIATP